MQLKVLGFVAFLYYIYFFFSLVYCFGSFVRFLYFFLRRSNCLVGEFGHLIVDAIYPRRLCSLLMCFRAILCAFHYI